MNKTKPVLTIFRGLPGSGKSTAARKLSEETGAFFIEPDMVHIKNGQYLFNRDKHEDGDKRCVDFVECLMGEFGCDLIYADVLPTRKSVSVFVELANKHGYCFVLREFLIDKETSRQRNKHGVLGDDLNRMVVAWENFC